MKHKKRKIIFACANCGWRGDQDKVNFYVEDDNVGKPEYHRVGGISTHVHAFPSPPQSPNASEILGRGVLGEHHGLVSGCW